VNRLHNGLSRHRKVIYFIGLRWRSIVQRHAPLCTMVPCGHSVGSGNVIMMVEGLGLTTTSPKAPKHLDHI